MKVTFLGLTSLLFSLFSCGQSKSTPAERFIAFLNNYQEDSLNNLLTDDFKLIRTYSNFVNDKKAFLQDYIPNSKAYNGKYDILRVINNVEPSQFLVEDRSDYFKYLKIANPQWIMTFISKGNKIEQVRIDSTEFYSKFLADTRVKNSDFDSWLKEKHTEITFETILKTDGLLIKLLKEYSEERK